MTTLNFNQDVNTCMPNGKKSFFNSFSRRQFVLKIILFLAVLLSAVVVKAQMDLSIVWQKPAGERINSAKFSSDGNFIYCAIGNTIKKMDAKNGEFISTFDNRDVPAIYEVYRMNISKSCNFIISTDGNGAVLIWDTKLEKAIKFYQCGASSVAITNDEKYLLIGSGRDETKGIIKFDLAKDTIMKLSKFSHNGISQIAISNDGSRFVTGSYYKDEYTNKFYNQLILWDTETLTALDTLQTQEITSGNYGYRLIKFSPDDKYLGCIRESMDGPDIFDLSTREMVRTSDGRACASLIFLPISNYYIAVLAETGFCVYELKEHKPIKYYNTEIYGGGYLEVSDLINGEFSIFSIGAGGYDGIGLIKGSITNVNEITNEFLDLLINYESEYLKVTLNVSEAEKALILIYDFRGNLKLQDSVILEPNQPLLLNFKERSGIYFCKVVTNNKEYTKKFEVVR